METQGQPPGKILDSGLKTAFYFDKQLYFTTSTWKLKVLSTLQFFTLQIYNLSVLMSFLSFQTPEQFVSETGIKFTEKRMMKLTSLDDLKNVGVLLDCSILYV